MAETRSFYMRDVEYEKMFGLEDRHWWYLGMREIAFSILKSIENNYYFSKVLDAGCGTGGILNYIKKYFLDPIGTDISEKALRLCKTRNLKKLCCADIDSMPFKDETFNLITCFEVLCQRRVCNDEYALKELYRMCKKGGKLLIRLPAFNLLYSLHDKAADTKRRYTKDYLKEKLIKCGFVIRRVTYANTLLFPFELFWRIFAKFFKNNNSTLNSDLNKTNKFLNKLFLYVLTLEKMILKKIDLPFGLSIICIAEKV